MRSLRVRLLSLVLFVSGGSAVAAPLCTERAFDVPGSCPCAELAVEWPLPAIPGKIFDTGLQLWGMRESCAQNRGQPFWQLQQSFDSPTELASWLDRTDPDNPDLWPSAQNWSTEFYTHVLDRVLSNVAGVDLGPFGTFGPRTPLAMMDWFIRQDETRVARAIAENAFPGFSGAIPPPRGRWIDGSELVLGLQFLPGFNAPCPGAYQLADYLIFPGIVDLWDDAALGQIVGPMTVYRDVRGYVIGFDAELLMGDLPFGTVHEDGSAVGSVLLLQQDGLHDTTRDGFSSLGDLGSRRVRGWGIPRHPLTGNPLCDYEAITYVDLGTIEDLPFEASGPDPSTADLVDPYLDFEQRRGGAETIFTSNFDSFDGLPEADESWIFPAGTYGDSPRAGFDLQVDWAYPITGVALEWGDGNVPPFVKLEVTSDEAGVVSAESVQLESAPSTDDSGRVVFHFDKTSVRAVTVVLDPQLDADYRLVDLELQFDIGNDDADPASDPTSVDGGTRGSSVLAWTDGPSVFANGTVELFARIGAGAEARLRVVDPRGRQVAVRDLGARDLERRRIVWNGRDRSGRRVAAGVYFLRLEANGEAVARKVTLLR